MGGSAYWVLWTVDGTGSVAAVSCGAITFRTRVAAVTYGWSLPTARTLGLTREEVDDRWPRPDDDRTGRSTRSGHLLTGW